MIVHKSGLTINNIMINLVIFGLLSAIVLPGVTIGSISLYLVTIISPIVFFLVIILFIMKKDGRYNINIAVLYPLFLGVMVVISSLRSWALGLSLVNISDFLEAIKYLQFVPYLMAIPFLVKDNVLRLMHYSLLYSCGLFLIIGFVQYFKISNISEYLTLIYLGSDSNHLISVLNGHRITVTGSDPNIGGVISYFFALYFMILSLNRRSVFYFILFILCSFLGFMTQTRTGMIGFFISISIYIVLISNIKFFYKNLIVLVIITLIFYALSVLNLEYIILGFEHALEGENPSVNVRLDNLSLAFERFHNSPIFGYGPAKSEFTAIIDSEYALILQRYGIVGIVVFTIYFVYLFKLSRNTIQTIWGASLMAFSILALIIMLTNNVFSGYQLMSIVVFLNIACVISKNIQCEYESLLI